MPLMSVTLEVSTLSGWLKAYALCRVQKGGNRQRDDACGTWRCGTEGMKGESAAHAACVCGPARKWGQKAQAEAHSEHAAHVCDAGGVKAQRPVEIIRTLPSPKRGQPTEGRRVWHTEMRHREKGKCNQQRTPRGVRVCGPAREWGQKRRRWKRTMNMPPMSVTLEVSKLSGWLKAPALCRVQKGASDRGTTRVAHGDVAQREGRISSARGVRVWPSSGVGAEGAGGSAHRT
jgi:hypothetical protein